MEPKFNTSFIPKKPVVSVPGAVSRGSGSTNIFNVIATVIFVVTLLATGGAFLYRNILSGQIAQADKDLNDARAAFETDKIQNILDANTRIMSVKNLLEKHIVVSELLTLLQELTVKRMRLTALSYKNVNGSPSLSLDGEAQTYNALAEQSETFSKSEFLKGQNFSNFSLQDNGFVKATFSAGLDPTLISYKKAIESLSSNQ